MRRGELADAERLAREAVELASRNDWCVLPGDALLARAGVLRTAGVAAESDGALREALGLFDT